MSTMNISLPDNLKSFVDEQVSQRGYGTSSEYVRDLIRRDKERTEAEGFARLKAELTAAFAAPETAYEELDAETVIARNTRG